MHATSSTARLSRFAIIAVTGATALSVAACGASNNASNNAKPTSASPPSAAPTSSPSASPKGNDWVRGLIDSVSGNTIQVSQRSGTATVDFAPSTEVAELAPAQLTDVTAGSCVSVHPDHQSASKRASGITARSVWVSTAVDGKCPEPNRPAGAATTLPPAAPPSHHQVQGQVTAAAGNTITVNSVDPSGNPSQTTVNVTDATKYTKQTTADAQALTQGKCLAAHGTRDGGGTLQAKAITIQQADNGSCPESGARHHRH
jgi:hypothetical protein